MVKVTHDSETPAHGQQVITACAFIHHNFEGVIKVFLPKRAPTKKFLPDIYELPGGHIDYGEDILDGLKREIKEELDMHIRIGDPYAAFTYYNAIKGSHSIEVIYFATFIEPLEQITIQPEDHSRYDWFTKEEVVAHRTAMIPTNHAIHQEIGEDIEYQNVLKGFELLSGQSPDFATNPI